MCQAGLFSAVTSAFIIQVDSQLRPDSGDDTAALLRILLYKMDNTTFGNEVPTLPQWTGPPPAMVHVQAILFASLSASLLSAFLAMLGKQWLNRYVSTNNRGSAIDRCQNRQRKLDGIVAWYFDSVMESLPLMLQVALLLLGCSLSRYLWETSMTVASVVIGVTSFGLLLYLFILIVGTAWESCPYQTPGSYFFRYLGTAVHSVVRPAVLSLGNSLKGSALVIFSTKVLDREVWSSWGDITLNLVSLFPLVSIAFALDVYRLGRVSVKALTTLLIQSPHLPRRVYLYSRWWFGQSTAAPDLQCALWTLQTFPNGPVRLSTLKYLLTSTEFTSLDCSLIVEYFGLLVGCISISNNKVGVIQGLEQLATVYARGFFHILHRLEGTLANPDNPERNPVCAHYRRIFHWDTDFRGLPFYHPMVKIHALLTGHREDSVSWTDYRPSNQELIPFALHMVGAAQEEYQQTESKKMPCWILRFALHFLALDPPAPASVIADCLMIIAIALDHNPPSASDSDERCVYSIFWEFTALTKAQ